MTKQYKPGQLITIDHKVYRVKKYDDFTGCYSCEFINKSSREEPCRTLCMINDKLPRSCYLELVKS